MHASRYLLAALACLLVVGCGPSRPGASAAPTAQVVAEPPNLVARPAPPQAARPGTDRAPAGFRIEGPLEQRGAGVWVVDGTPVLVGDDTQLLGDPVEGAWVTIDGREDPGGARRAAVIGAVEVVELTGRLERVEGEIWTIDGTPVRVGPETDAVAAPQPGVYLRVIARIDVQVDVVLVALRVAPARELTLVGQVDAVDATTLVVEDQQLRLAPDSLLAAGVSVGAYVRVTVRIDDDGTLVVRVVLVLPAVKVVDGPIELIDDDVIVVGGQRLRLSPRVVLVRVVLALGQPVRLILSDDGTIVIAIIAVRVVVVAPPPAPPPAVIVVPAPPPPPPPAPVYNNDDDDDDD